MPTYTRIPKKYAKLEAKITIDKLMRYFFPIGKMGKYYVMYSDSDLITEGDYNRTVILGEFIGQKFQPIVRVDLNKCSRMRYSVGFLYATARYRGKNLPAKLYRYLVTEADYTLLSGPEQSPGGQAVWRALSKFTDVDVSLTRGYRKLTASPYKLKNGIYYAVEDMDISNCRLIAKKNDFKGMAYSF